MARHKSDKRQKAFELWQESGRTMQLKDIASALNISASQIRKWKSQDKWEEQSKGNVTKSKGNVTKRGAPKGSKNASGNDGGPPEKNKNAERHGFFSRIFPNDEETMAIVNSIEIKNPLDILWENIVIQYTAIARAQKIMFVKDKNDMTKEKSGSSSGERSDSITYTIQFAWDKHSNFLQAQSRAMATLEKLISRYDEMLPGAIKYEDQRLRIEKIKADIANDREKLKLDQAKFDIDKLKSAGGGGIEANNERILTLAKLLNNPVPNRNIEDFENDEDDDGNDAPVGGDQPHD